MSGLLGWLRRPPLLAAVCVAMACPVAGCSAAGRGGHPVTPTRAAAGHSQHAPSRPGPSPGPAAPLRVPAMGDDPSKLAGQLTVAERVLGAGAPPAATARQAFIVQLACLLVAAHRGWAHAVIAKVAPAQRAAAATDIAATADLVALTQPLTRLPPWRIVAAASPAALRAYYRSAQSATGVGWFYLAAINFIETDFGRVAGPSTAGAQGPMQFLPATWAIYGHGNIHRAKNAILAAARFLADHGATRDIAAAVYAYNPSWLYVDAVLHYARRLRRDPRALAGYYDRQVICRLTRGWVLLPAGYGLDPAANPIRLHL